MNSYVLSAAIAALPATIAAVASLRNGRKTDAVSSSLHSTNGGSNVKDQLNRIEWKIEQVEDKADRAAVAAAAATAAASDAARLAAGAATAQYESEEMVVARVIAAIYDHGTPGASK